MVPTYGRELEKARKASAYRITESSCLIIEKQYRAHRNDSFHPITEQVTAPTKEGTYLYSCSCLLMTENRIFSYTILCAPGAYAGKARKLLGASIKQTIGITALDAGR